ncbi:DUF4329 domain-containing protein [Aurantiacibacter sp. D1-12]|uniref:DUF4329 domain-containing protein n=1 Tax=Aurantiacibacter sp. D1-12 TaxID=2993658 RepID=UPI00237CECF1|nr:DUF4329 domain-containing protein [Aurantiacibacter sp. D1-12]MDE1466835.1 DUF4329 domain-containing protein [Aurantiacibacter sp. D1-12]
MNEGRVTIAVLVLCAALWAGIVLRQSSENLGNEIYERTATDAQVQQAAREQLSNLQQQSFAEDTEYCGLLAENADGEIVSRTVIVGDHESCDITYFDVRTLYPLATYHTHAGFNTDYDSEVPSTLDIESDMASGMDGFVSTPGGRFWHIDAETGTATQVCGEGCLPSDPRYRPCNGAAPEESYTLASLRARFGSLLPSC